MTTPGRFKSFILPQEEQYQDQIPKEAVTCVHPSTANAPVMHDASGAQKAQPADGHRADQSAALLDAGNAVYQLASSATPVSILERLLAQQRVFVANMRWDLG